MLAQLTIYWWVKGVYSLKMIIKIFVLKSFFKQKNNVSDYLFLDHNLQATFQWSIQLSESKPIERDKYSW